MLDTKLILVDGIPGSGKSTTAQWIAIELRKRQIEADWFMDEHRGNPITIWDDSSPESFISRTLDNWKQLTQASQTSHQIIVLEGCLLQHILGRLLSQDIERARIIACIQAVYDHIRPLQPILIYFYQANLELALRTVYAERGSEWAEYMLKGLEKSPYAVSRQLTGFEALFQYYHEDRTLTDRLLQGLGIRTLAVENSKREWLVYQEQIRQYLMLSPLIREPMGTDYLAQLEGHYRDWSGSHPHNPECTVQMDSSGLVIHDFRYPKSKLIPKATREVYVETLGYELAFETDSESQVMKMKVGGKEPAVGIGPVTLLGREFHRIWDRLKPLE